MKPTGETTPKLSKSIKKSSKSRSKGSKSSNQSPSSHQQQFQQDFTATPGPSDQFKERPHHRSYAGFGPKSVKVIWEQHDASDTEVMPDVYTRLAEDVTYKMWELVNTIKSYARHSGGRVTCDIVNEVLRDSDVPPILGTVDSEWERIEYDGSFYFNNDQIVDLRQEYLKEEQMSNSVIGEITTNWCIDRKHSKILLEFISTLCNAIFLGDDSAFKYGLDIAAFSPHIGCSLKLLLKKSIEMLAFEQKSKIIERCMEFFRALTFNISSRDVECNEQLFHISELMICLIMGTYDLVKIVKMEIKEEKNFSENIGQVKESGGENFNDVDVDVDDIRTAYEALFQMMERDGYKEKDNIEDIKVEPIACLEGGGGGGVGVGEGITIKIEPGIEIQETEPSASKEPIQSEFSPYKTEMVGLESVDLICTTLGEMSCQYGYLHNECTFLIERRLSKFFKNRASISDNDYEFISRSVKALVALGEYSFREIIPYLPQIDPFLAPEWINKDFSAAAIFLNGRDDIYLYEWLEALCGNQLQPFMLYFHKYLQRLTTERIKNLRTQTYSIPSKIVLKMIEKRLSCPTSLIECFEDMVPMKKIPKKIGFRFAGCRPVILKVKSNSVETTLVQKPLTNFNARTIIGRRKLLKPLSDKKKYVSLSNFSHLQI